MSKRITVSRLVRNGKRAVAVAMVALLLGVLRAPEPSLAAQIHPRTQSITHVVHPDGSGDSPVMP